MKMPNEKNIDYYMSLPYREVIESSPEGGYVATIPDLKGCITQAETLTELVDMIKDAKLCWLESALDYGTEIPEPSSKHMMNIAEVIDLEFLSRYTKNWL
jgi:antitoxin HicB